jgi:hypothetical protein
MLGPCEGGDAARAEAVVVQALERLDRGHHAVDCRHAERLGDLAVQGPIPA